MIRRRNIAAVVALSALALVAALAVVPRLSAAPTCTINWDGGGGTSDWNTAANWDTNVVPGSSDNVCIAGGNTVVHSSGTATVLTIQAAGSLTLSGGTLTLTSATDASTADSMTITGGTLGGAGELDLSGTSTWSGGSMDGAGTTQVAAGATLVHNNYTYLTNTRTLEIAGTLDLQADRGIYNSGTVGHVHVAAGGLIEKTTSAGTGWIDPPLDNDGAVRATSGSLELNGGSGAGSSQGSYGGAADAGTVRFNNGTHTLADGATILGGVDINGGTVTVPAAATATMSGTNTQTGATLGGAGTVTIASGTLTWSGGSMDGAGTTQVAAGATLVHTAYGYLSNGRILENAGTLDIHADGANIYSSGIQPGLVDNLSTGTVTKSLGAGTASIVARLHNAGTVSSTSGVLSLQGASPGPDTGTFTGIDAANHVTVTYGGNRTLATGAQLVGYVEIDGATIGVADGVTLEVPGTLALASGTLAGPGDVHVTGTLLWTGGAQAGPGTTTIAVGGQLTGDADCSVSLTQNRVLHNLGTIALLHQTEIGAYNYGGSPPTIQNDGLLQIDDSAAGLCGTGGISGNAVLANSGTIDKFGGSNSALVQGSPLQNSGSIVSHAGSLQVESDTPASQTGSFGQSAAGGTIEFYDGRFALAPSATVAGDIAVTYAEVDIPEGSEITVGAGDHMTQTSGTIGGLGTLRIAGTLTWSGGNQRDAGNTEIEPGGVVDVNGGLYDDAGLGSDRALVNRGTITVTTDSAIYASDGASILNKAQINLQDGSLSGYGSYGYGYGAGALLHNVGTITKSGAGTGRINTVVDNDGTLEVTGGILSIEGTLLNYSTSDPYSNTDSALTGGTFAAHGAELRLPGPVETNGAHLILDGTGAQLTYLVSSYPDVVASALAGFDRNAGAGVFELEGDASFTTAGVLRNAGTIRLRDTATLTTTGDLRQSGGLTSIEDAGTQLTTSGGKLDLVGGRLAGRGSAGPLVAASGGVVEPGIANQGTLTLSAFDAGPGATVRFAPAGPTAGTDFGRLVVTGAAQLGGTLAIATDPAYQPGLGTQLSIIGYASHSGSFGTVTGADLPDGNHYSVDYGAGGVTLTVAAPAAALAAPTTDATSLAPTSGDQTQASEKLVIDDRRLAGVSGEWARLRIGTRTVTSSSLRGSTLELRVTRPRALAVRVRTCPHCGVLYVYWRGHIVRRISLRSTRPHWRLVPVATWKRPRSGVLALRVGSERSVAIDAVVAYRGRGAPPPAPASPAPST